MKIATRVTFIVALSFIPLALRLEGAIHWSWWWVLCPFWGGLAMLLLITMIVTVIEGVMEYNLRRRDKTRINR